MLYATATYGLSVMEAADNQKRAISWSPRGRNRNENENENENS
jgi:hypothetical protein